MTLAGKLALVTGATRGIGRAIALQLGRDGATVIGTATSEGGAAQIREALAQAGVQGTGVVLNVRDAAACDALVESLQKERGDVLVLVNNAGITRDNLALRMKDAEWDEVMETNLKAVFRLSRAVMRGMMKARWGRIINITSVVGASGNPGQANYAAAKAGVRVVLLQPGAPSDERVHCTGPVNHRALFPRCAAVVHHGGAGTTSAAARAGVPQVFAPHVTDQFFWAVLVFLAARLLRTRDARWWIAIGAIAGVGLLNKHTVLFVLVLLCGGLLLTPERRLLASRYAVIGGVLALTIWAPNVWWQLTHDLPARDMSSAISERPPGSGSARRPARSTPRAPAGRSSPARPG